jgi:hypothetical protein
MTPRNEDRPRGALVSAKDLLAFRPWMLAAAVFLGCALGIAIMEELRGPSEMWAQVSTQTAPSP